ncbi:MAG: hypothetical protein GY820_22320 [Gammaproteobacteria bacterium]|nr:hypothetical protein [Gammaproteobacteria bacterium]
MFNHEEENNNESWDIEFAEQANESMEIGTKAVFTAGSVFCLLQYIDKLSESCRFLRVFGPFWHYFDALACFVSAYYKWQSGDKVKAGRVLRRNDFVTNNLENFFKFRPK